MGTKHEKFLGNHRYFYYCAKPKGSSNHSRNMVAYFSIARYGEEDAKARCDFFIEKLNALVDRRRLGVAGSNSS